MVDLGFLWFNTKAVMLEALPFLAFGFFVAGLLKAFVPDTLIAKYLGKDNFFAPIKAAILGMPIPLCSCSVIPVATGLRRGGAGRGSLSSFLISAPETGVDSLSITYAMLGPFLLVSRIISALLTAILTGWAIMGFTKGRPMRPLDSDKVEKACCSAEKDENKVPVHGIRTNQGMDTSGSVWARFVKGQRHAFTMLLDDSFKWVMIALIMTVAIKTWVSNDFFTGYGDGIVSMLVMVAISFPLYICASASTPVAAGLLLAGISPGSVLVFMLAGPASNLATIGVVSKLINKRAAIIYVLGVIVCSVTAGLILNQVIATFNIDILAEVQQESILHSYIAIPTSVFVLLASIKPLRPYIGLVARKA